MTGIEITLLVLGAIIFAASFIVPELKKEPSKEQQKFSEAEIKKVIDREMEHVRDRVDEVVEETIDYTMEKTERSLAKISNEKIMAVNEYSDTVLSEINKNHKEVMFLYDMLNDKQTDLKNEVRKAEATKEEAVAAAAKVTNAGFSTMEFEHVTQESFRGQTAEQPEIQVPQQSQEVVRESGPEPIFNRFAEGMDETVLPIQERVIKKEIPRATVQKAAPVKKQPAGRVDEREPQASGGVKNNNRRILEMHREGKTNIAIAKELGLGLGEVKLVIDLFEGA